MSSSMRHLLLRMERVLWPDCLYRLTPGLRRALAGHKLVLADVGAAGGLHERWERLRPFLYLLAFEPDARLHRPLETDGRVWPVALGARRGTGTLHLTRSERSSSLYPLHHDFLRDFANYGGHAQVGELSVEVRTMDECLRDDPGHPPHFLKIDAEGSDLDVLRGAQQALGASVLGVQVEVSFAPRHTGAPFFGDIDAFLRERGFTLFQLSREHWVRRNRILAATSRPQLVWADAVYFLGRARFLELLRRAPAAKRDATAAAFITLLLAYQVHDYADEIIEAVKREGLIGAPFAEELDRAARASQLGCAKAFCRLLPAAALLPTAWLFCWIISRPLGKLRRRVKYGFRASARKFFSQVHEAGVRVSSGDSVSDEF